MTTKMVIRARQGSDPRNNLCPAHRVEAIIMTPFFKADLILYHKYGSMVIMRSGKRIFIM